MGWRFDLGKLEPEHRAIVMKKDEEEKRRMEEESKRKANFQKVDQKEKSPIFCLLYAGTSASAQEITGEFFVLKGSLARKTQTNNLAKSNIQIREKLVQDGILINSQDNDFWIFSRNFNFKTPSIAAKVVCGTSINGRQAWKIQGTSQSYAKWSTERK